MSRRLSVHIQFSYSSKLTCFYPHQFFAFFITFFSVFFAVWVASSMSFLFSLESPFTVSFFHFILRFWNHVLTWVSFNPRVCASLPRLVVSKYFCSKNVFSSTRSCKSVKTVRDFLHRRPLGVRNVGFTRKYTGSLLITSGLGSSRRKIKIKKINIQPSQKVTIYKDVENDFKGPNLKQDSYFHVK